MIVAEALSKRYEDGKLALDNLSLSIRSGEIYCLLGANGAGKTTTINLFLGFIEPTSGRPIVNGVNVHEDPLQGKKHVAFLDEQVKVYANMTALQNLRFFAGLSGRTLEDDEASGILSSSGLGKDVQRRKCGSFSKGMRQKLGIAIAVAKNAPALFLDEPTSGLDPGAAADLLESLRRQRDRGNAILMNTHDIFRARQLADRVGIMLDGRLVAEFAAAELNAHELEEIYLSYMSSRHLAEVGSAGRARDIS